MLGIRFDRESSMSPVEIKLESKLGSVVKRVQSWEGSRGV